MFLFVPGKTITVIIIVTIITDHHQPSFSAPGLTNAKVSVGCPPLLSTVLNRDVLLRSAL